MLTGLRRWVSPGTIRWLGIAMTLASLATLALFLQRSDWRQLVVPIGNAKPALLAAAVVLALGVEVIKTVRWQLLLGAEFAALPNLLATLLTSRLMNALAPLRAGDVWRVAAAAKAEARPILTSGGSVVAEKVLDAAGLAVIGVVILGQGGLSSQRSTIAGAAVVAAFVFSGLFLRVLRKRGRVPAWVSDGMAHLRSPSTLVWCLGLTGFAFIAGGIVNLMVLAALGMPAGIAAGAIMLLAGYAAGVLPAGPGRLAVFELSVAAPLTTVGLPTSSSVAAAVALHVVLLVALGLGGLAALALGLAKPTGSKQRVPRPARADVG